MLRDTGVTDSGKLRCSIVAISIGSKGPVAVLNNTCGKRIFVAVCSNVRKLRQKLRPAAV